MITDQTGSRPPFALGELDHIVLRAADVERLTAFYIDVLGCAVERVAGNLVQLRAGRALIDIVPRDRDDAESRNLDHFCLTIVPFDAASLSQWLSNQGLDVPPVANRYGAGGDGPSLYLTDPEGNGIELKGRAGQ